jgi:hypothetical protein
MSPGRTVTAQRIRGLRPAPEDFREGSFFDGILPEWPRPGESLVIFRTPDGCRMLTSPVKRVLTDADDPDLLYVETENSTYRLKFRP